MKKKKCLHLVMFLSQKKNNNFLKKHGGKLTKKRF